MTESPNQKPTLSRLGPTSVEFKQAEKMPGEWRTIEVEVDGGKIKASWINPDRTSVPFKELSATEIHQTFTAPHTALNKVDPNNGIVFPDWNPRAPLGVWAEGSSVAIRNVTVTPLTNRAPLN